VSPLIWPWRAWSAIWDFEANAALMNRLRVGIGVMWVWLYLTLYANAAMLFDARLGVETKVMRTTLGGYHLDWFDNIHGDQVPALITAGLIASILFTAGVVPQACAVVMYVIHLGLQYRSYAWMDGSDDLLRCVLFFLALVPWRRSATSYPGWPLRLVQLQVATMYLATAVFKGRGRDWWDGTALYWGLSDPRWQRFPTDWLCGTALGQHLLQGGTWFAFAAEGALPLLLLVPRTRKAGVILGAGLHLGILLTMRVGLFTPAVLACYLAFWELKGDRRSPDISGSVAAPPG